MSNPIASNGGPLRTDRVSVRGIMTGLQLMLLVAAGSCRGPVQVREADPTTQPAQSVKAQSQAEFPGLRVDRDAGVVDLEAVVAQRDAEWLELIACSPGTREHEAIVTVAAKPSHIHLALVLLGLEPGSPMTAKRHDDQWQVEQPTGPEVEVFFVWEEVGEERMVPANEWVRNQETGRRLEGNTWLFAGSRFQSFQGRQFFLADEHGTVISLVNFGDDLLARPTTVTNETDNKVWATTSELIPEIGTPLTVRLRPATPSSTNH